MIYNDPTLRKKKAQDVTLTLTGTGNTSECYIQIAGIKYSSAQTLEIKTGTEVYCYASSFSGAMIQLNGALVSSSASGETDYLYTISSDAKIQFSYEGMFGSNIFITEN